MSKILIIGGHGKVARLLAPKLVQQGHSVTSVIRKVEQVPEVTSEGIEAVVSDAEELDATGFAELTGGHDAVVWSAGAGGGSPERTYRLDRDAAIQSMQGALQAGVSRYVMVSYAGSSLEHGVDPAHGFYAYAQSKAIADAALRDTKLDWTIVGPSALTSDPGTGTVEAADTAEQVSREDVAGVIAQVLADDSSIHRTLAFNSGQTPIPEFVQQK